MHQISNHNKNFLLKLVKSQQIARLELNVILSFDTNVAFGHIVVNRHVKIANLTMDIKNSWPF